MIQLRPDTKKQVRLDSMIQFRPDTPMAKTGPAWFNPLDGKWERQWRSAQFYHKPYMKSLLLKIDRNKNASEARCEEI